MKGIDLIKYIYDNNLNDAEIVLGVEGYTADPKENNDKEIRVSKTDDGRILLSDDEDYSENFVQKNYYKIRITETYEKDFIILAKSEEEAESLAEDEYNNSNIENFTSDTEPVDSSVECIGDIPEGEIGYYEKIETE